MWNSSDEMIATVDNNGIVTAVSEGEVEISGTVKSSKSVARCKVICKRDLDTQIVISNKSSYRYADDYILGIRPNTYELEFSSNFDNKQLEYYKSDYSKLSEDDCIGTGMFVQLRDNELMLESRQIIVLGDLTGDGKLNNKDIVKLTRSLLKLEELSDAQQLAADVNSDGQVNNQNIALLSRVMKAVKKH